MEVTNKLVEIIDQIFDTICIIYDETEFSFDFPAELLQKFQNALELAKKLDVKDITKEIWDATSKSQREDKIIHLMNFKFDKLITWKPDARDISILNQDLKKDIDLFLVKQAQIKRNYAQGERVQIERFYMAIAHRLLKANLDLAKVMSQLIKMQEDELSSGNESEELYIIKNNNISLNPTKRGEFSAVMNEMFDNNFFIPVDSSIPFSKIDILIAFNEFLHTSLESNESIDIKPVLSKLVVNRIEGQKYFSDYLLHEKKEKLADEIKKNFPTEKSKSIRYLLEALAQSQSTLITIIEGEKNALYNAIKEFFNRDIGSYNSIFQCKFNPDSDPVEKQNLEKYKVRIKHILDKL